jgi:shikimate kinase
VLVGLMGAGKSTVGRKLAEMAGLPFVDLDEEITTRTGRSIADVFHADGESEFRRLEAEATAALNPGDEGLIVAAGGGWMANRAARTALRDAVIVWLKVSPELAARRVSGAAGGRPLLTGLSATDRLRTILAERLPAYGEAMYTVDTEGRTPAEVVSEVAARVGFVPPDRDAKRTQTHEKRR